MNIKVISCSECGAPLRVAKGQFLSHCKYCNVKYYVNQDFPPAITIKDNIDISKAKRLVLDKLRDKSVSKNFLSNSFFEKGTLFFIPFIEIRGIKTRITSEKISGQNKFVYTAYDYIEHGSNLSDLEIDFIEGEILENSLLDAEQAEYDVVEMRRKGIVLPLKPDFSIKTEEANGGLDIIEKHIRIIYFPVWEINYSYGGIIFKSYISAIDGEIIKVQAIKDHRKKLILSIIGIFSISIILAQGLKYILFFNMDVGKKSGFNGISLIALLFGALLMLVISSLLIPYFWEMFAFREIISIRKTGIESRSIHYSENSLIKFLRSILNKIELFFSKVKIDDGK